MPVKNIKKAMLEVPVVQKQTAKQKLRQLHMPEEHQPPTDHKDAGDNERQEMIRARCKQKKPMQNTSCREGLLASHLCNYVVSKLSIARMQG